MIDNSKISSFAIQAIKKLKKNNYEAYLVGGCVRDSLTGITPKDFDVATNATPDQVRRIFKSSRIIGRRFKLVHLYSHNELIEIATFRAGKNSLSGDQNLVTDNLGKIIRDNVWGSINEDCQRRDFTVNALYYCPISKEIKDFNNGLLDIRKKRIVSIGDPLQRFEEVPVRSLRAIRFSTKLGFKLDTHIKHAIYDKGHLLFGVSNARLFDEMCKLFLHGSAEKNFLKLHKFNLLKYLVHTNPDQSNFAWSMIIEASKNTDTRVKEKKSVTPGFLMACILWPHLIKISSNKSSIDIRKFYRNIDFVLKAQQKYTAIPRSSQSYIKDIWILQLKLQSRIKRQPFKLVNHRRFRAAYDFLIVRERASGENTYLSDWWTKFQVNDEALKNSLIEQRKAEENNKTFGFLGELR